MREEILVYQDLMERTVSLELPAPKVWQDQQDLPDQLVLQVLKGPRVNPVLTVHLDQRVSKEIKDPKGHWDLWDFLVLPDR